MSKSFVDISHTSHFPLQNLPYGVFSTNSSPAKRVGVALGSNVIDLAALSDAGLLRSPHLQSSHCFHEVSAEAVPDVTHLSSKFSIVDYLDET